MFGLAKDFATVLILLFDMVFIGCKVTPFALKTAYSGSSAGVSYGNTLDTDGLANAASGQAAEETASLNRLSPKPLFSCVTNYNQDSLSCAEYYRDFMVGNKKIASCEILNSLLPADSQFHVEPVAKCQPSEAVKGCLVADAAGLTKKIWWYPKGANEVRYCQKVHRGVVIEPRKA